MPGVQVTIIGKPECHLCDVAKGVIGSVVADLSGSTAVTVVTKSILEDPELHERYWEKIPVVLVNGSEHAHWRVDPVTLRSAILEAHVA